MMRKSSNSLVDYLRTSKTSNDGSSARGSSALGSAFERNHFNESRSDIEGSIEAAVQGAGSGSGVSGADPSDQIVDLLRARGALPPDEIVRALGLRIGDVVATLDRLERFGFIRIEAVEGRPRVTLLAG